MGSNLSNLKKEDVRINGANAPEISGNNTLKNFLKGVVTRMILERKTTYIITTITVHDFQFNFRIDQGTAANLNLFPGKPVTLDFDGKKIKWI